MNATHCTWNFTNVIQNTTREEYHKKYLTGGFIGFTSVAFESKHNEWLRRRDEFYDKKGKAIPLKKLSQEQKKWKKMHYHPKPPVSISECPTVIPPTVMHATVHSTILIHTTMLLLVNRKDSAYAAIVQSIKKQYNYLNNGDIASCGEEVAKFMKKFSISSILFYFEAFVLSYLL